METPSKVEHKQSDLGYVPVYATGVVEQPWADYTRDEHRVWDTLFARQRELLPGRACREFLDGVKRFGLGDGGIPKFSELNKVLGAATGNTSEQIKGKAQEIKGKIQQEIGKAKQRVDPEPGVDGA